MGDQAGVDRDEVVRMDAGKGETPFRIDVRLDCRPVVPGFGGRYGVQEGYRAQLAEPAQRLAQNRLFLRQLRLVAELLLLAAAAAGAKEGARRLDAARAGLVDAVQLAVQDAARRAADRDVRDVARHAVGDKDDAPVLQRIDGIATQGHAAAGAASACATRRAADIFAQTDSFRTHSRSVHRWRSGHPPAYPKRERRVACRRGSAAR